MGQKDIAEKILEAHNDVFSDIVNVLLFNGEQIIHKDELEEQAPRAVYKADGKLREIERDVAKRWKKENIRLACVGLENQTDPDPDMALRIMGYDGAEYRAQLNDENHPERYPVVTLVLYFGTRKHWDQPLTLFDTLKIPEQFKPFVNDYKINLFEIAYLSEEQIKLFQSDFKVVADFFVQLRKTGTYVGSKETIVHIQETLSLLSIFAKDNRFESVLQETSESAADGKEIKNMCDVLDRIQERGREEGELNTKIETARNMAAEGMNVAVIARVLKVSEASVMEWIGLKTA